MQVNLSDAFLETGFSLEKQKGRKVLGLVSCVQRPQKKKKKKVQKGGIKGKLHFTKPEPSVCTNASHLLVGLRLWAALALSFPLTLSPSNASKKTLLVSIEVRRAFLYGSGVWCRNNPGSVSRLTLDWGPLCTVPQAGPNWTFPRNPKDGPCRG